MVAAVKLTPQQKQQKAELLDLTKAKNRALSQLNFGLIKTYEDFLLSLGHQRETVACYYYNQRQLSQPVTRPDILAFFRSYETELLQKHAGVYDNFTYEFVPHEYEGVYYDGTNSVGIPDNIVDSANIVVGDTTDKLEEQLPPSDKQLCNLFAFQERAAVQLLNNIIKKGMRGQLLRAAVGTGKTFIIAAVARRLIDMGYCTDKTFSPWPIVYVTKASIVQQTERVLEKLFGIDIVNEVKVINIEQLRASFGELMVRTETVVYHGEEQIKWVWRRGVHPLIILWDECQILKNTDSRQSQLAQAFNDINTPETIQIFFSATPFLRVCEAKCFAVATRLKRKYGITEGVALSNESWADYANHIAGHESEPEEYNQAAVKRLMESLDPYIVDVKGVRPQFNALNSIQLIKFQTVEERMFYEEAWNKYEERRKKIEGFELSGGQSKFLILAQFTIFRKAAELCRAERLADDMYEAVQAGQAACLAVNFKGTIRRVVQILDAKYGVSRDNISLIWGGGKTAKNEKQKKKEKLDAAPDVLALLGELGMSMDDLKLGDVDEYVDDDKDNAITHRLRLGNQSKVERQKEIDRFQSGKSLYCMFTFKAGGVGLSLHHTDEMTREKCRRKKNNWVYPEDVVKIPTRPRVCFLAPTFSAIELVQGLGRCPRLTSLSDTTQIVIFYQGTIEERVAAIVSQKLRCLREVVRTRESWESVIHEHHTDTTVLIENGVATADAADNTAALFGVGEEEDEEESIEV